MEGRRFVKDGKNYIAVRSAGDQHFLVIDEANTKSGFMSRQAIEELPENPYGNPIKGDFVVIDDQCGHNSKAYLVVSDTEMQQEGVRHDLVSTVRVIRRFQPGFSISIGPNYYIIEKMEENYTEYIQLKLEGVDSSHMAITEYMYPF
jgi:hypothetical protein